MVTANQANDESQDRLQENSKEKKENRTGRAVARWAGVPANRAKPLNQVYHPLLARRAGVPASQAEPPDTSRKVIHQSKAGRGTGQPSNQNTLINTKAA